MKDVITRVLAFLALLTSLGESRVQAEPILYATDAVRQQLYTVSPSDDGNDILYGSTTLTNNLYSINRLTGSARLIGPLGVPLMHALAFDNLTGTLYGAYGRNQGFYRIDPQTGAATLIGISGFTISGLAFDPVSRALYASTFAPGEERLLRIDPSTGQATPVANLGFTGISFDPETGTLYGISNGALALLQGLYTVDLASATASRVGPVALENPLDLQFVPTQAIPEPGSLLLVGVGTLGLLGCGWCRRKSNSEPPRQVSQAVKLDRVHGQPRPL
jgi:hypothetical protein